MRRIDVRDNIDDDGSVDRPPSVGEPPESLLKGSDRALGRGLEYKDIGETTVGAMLSDRDTAQTHFDGNDRFMFHFSGPWVQGYGRSPEFRSITRTV